MSVIISMVNVKGGVGKTTTAINLAGAIAKQQHKVLLIDNDSQSNISQILNVKTDYNLYDLYTNKRVDAPECIGQYNKYIYVLPNNIDSADLESELHSKRNKESVLREKFENLDVDAYDFILIDNSPFLGVMVQNSLVLSNYYFEVIDNSTSALQGLNMVTKVIDKLKEFDLNNNIKLLGILKNNFEKRTIFNREFSEVVEEEYKGKLFKTVIYNSVKYKEAVAMGQTIQEYSPKHSEAYKTLYYEIVERIKK